MNLEKTIRNLEGRGFRVSHFEKAEDAAAHIAAAVSGKTVGIDGSKTVEALGLYEKLAENNTVYWHWKTPGRGTLNTAALTDVYLSSANAITTAPATASPLPFSATKRSSSSRARTRSPRTLTRHSSGRAMSRR